MLDYLLNLIVGVALKKKKKTKEVNNLKLTVYGYSKWLLWRSCSGPLVYFLLKRFKLFGFPTFRL